MERLNPDKLFVEFRQGVTRTQPILNRKYTLTHSDVTAELFLTIGIYYAYDKITAMRDEVLAEWRYLNDRLVLNVYVYVDGQFGPALAEIRNRIFIRELPLALEAIVYGDRIFFDTHKGLYNAPIYVYFNATSPYYNRIEYWGTPSDYR